MCPILSWLALLLLVKVINARGLASDFQPSEPKNKSSLSKVNGNLFDYSRETDNMNFIYQFLLGNMSGGFDKEINNNIKGKNEDQDDQFIMKNYNHEIDSKSPVGRLYQAPIVVNERQNKIYWTDEELGLDSRVPDEDANANQQVQDFDSLKIDESSKEGKILQKPDDYDQQVFFAKVPEDTSNENEDSIQRQAQDRQLVVPVNAAADFSQGNIEDKFQEIVFTLPNLIDQTKDFIVEDIASKNMLGYTIAGSYFVGAFLDTIGELLITGRFIRDVIVKKEFFFLMGWLWWYALGFAGPWLFPAIFSGGNPYLACSSANYFSILASSNLSLNINTITNRPQGEMAILFEKLRVDFRDELGCIVHKQGDYKEAQHVQTQFDKMLSLINLHYQLSSPVPGPADLLALDQELASMWVQIPLLVEEAHADVTSRRAYTAAIYFLIGLFNVFGAVNGAMIFVVRKSNNLVGGEDIELVINQPTDVPMEEVPIKHLLIGNSLIGLGQGFGWGYGYYMTYFLFMEEADPGCGLVDMDDVYSRYQQLSSIQLFLSRGEVSKIVLRYIVEEWRRELGVALHCLLKTEEGTKLLDTLDMFVRLANTRLDLSPPN